MLKTPKITTIVVGVKDRFDPLKYTVPTWLADDRVKQLLMIDWNSSILLKDVMSEMTDDRRVKVIRVEGVDFWAATLAYNFAMQHITTDRFLKVDADVALTRSSVDGLFPDAKEFITINRKQVKGRNDGALTGTFAGRREDFLSIGGYDERIRQYGWEDMEIYNRLSFAGFKRRHFNISLFFHLPHSDDLRRKNSLDPSLTVKESMDKMYEDSVVREFWSTKNERAQYEQRGKDLFHLIKL